MKNFHVKLPSIEYQDFLIDNLKNNTNIPNVSVCRKPSEYPCFLVVKLLQGSVQLLWNSITSSSYDEVRFEDIEELIVKYFANKIFIDDKRVVFNGDGSITIGCTTVKADTLDKIYQRLHTDRKSENENS